MFECSSGTSNPESTITWLKNQTEMRSNVVEIGRYPADYGGNETKSK